MNMMKMNEQLVKQLREITRGYTKIQSIVLFDSRAHRDYNDLSNIDLAVKAPGLSEMKWLLLAEQVENEEDTLLKIDFISNDHASEASQEQIHQCYQVLYQT
jgi:predicted nucleotidyltransferase